MSLPAAFMLLAITVLFAAPAAAAPYCRVTPPPIAPPTDSTQVTTLQANRVSMGQETAVAIGNVRIEQEGQALEAPRLHYDRDKAVVSAKEGVTYFRPGLYLTADTAQMRMTDDTGEFSRANYVLMSNGGRGKAQHVQSLGNDQYLLTDATYTTCPGTTKAWLLTATSVTVNKNSGRGSAWNSVLHLYGLPVFYLPYINFPIDDRRHTGFLAPIFGSSSDTGYMAAFPYYINLAPNYDATITPRYLSKRGLQLNGQFRYLTRHHRGEVEGAWLPSDDEYNNEDRWLIDYEHTGKLLPNLGIELRYSEVSDIDYFDGLDTYLAETSESHLEQSASLTYKNTGVYFNVLAEKFQNLNSRDSGPYQRLPQVTLELQSPTAPFFAGLDAEYSIFKNDPLRNKPWQRDLIDATRLDLRPHINWAMDRGGWFASAEAALRYTRYDFADEPYTNNPSLRDASIERSIPVFSFGGGLRFERQLDNGWVQTLEPRFFYLYKGYEDQSDIPLFDTAMPDLSFARLFSARRFAGADRIADANQLALGMTSRFIEPGSGRTVLRFDVGRIQSFEESRVNLPGSYSAIETGYDNNSSDFIAGIHYAPSSNFNIGLIAQYDPDDSDFDRAIARMGYRHDSGFRINLAWRRYEDYRMLPTWSPYYKSGVHETDTLEQVQVGVAFPVGDAVDVYGNWAYSLEYDKDVEIDVGLEYRPSCCWATRMSWHREIDDDGTYDTAVMFQVILRGLGGFGKSFDVGNTPD